MRINTKALAALALVSGCIAGFTGGRRTILNVFKRLKHAESTPEEISSDDSIDEYSEMIGI